MQAVNFTAFTKAVREYLETGAGKDVVQVDDFIAESQIRLIRTESSHALMPWNADKMVFKINVLDALEDSLHQTFNSRKDGFFITEGHFNIDLGEFRLAVRSEVFITETSGNLEILLHAGNHQQLLEDLRGLGQGPESAVVDTGRHKVVTGAFRSGSGQNRGLDFDKAVFIEVLTGNHADTMTHHQILLQYRSSQIQISVLESCILGRGGVVRDVNRGCFSGVDNIDGFSLQFNIAGRHVGIAVLTDIDRTGHLQNVLIAHILYLFTQILIEDNLQKTGAVTQIHEYQGTEVSALVDPSDDGFFLACVTLAQSAAAACSFHISSFLSLIFL